MHACLFKIKNILIGYSSVLALDFKLLSGDYIRLCLLMPFVVIGVSIEALRSNVVNENRADIQLPGSCLLLLYMLYRCFTSLIC